VIPSPVVVHIHCVNAIALAARSDGEALVLKQLRSQADVVSAFVPYRKPGLPLAYAISERLTKNTNVFVLANHGLVVAGETAAEVADRITCVCEAFSAPTRPTSQADAEKLASIVKRSDYRLPKDPAAYARRARFEKSVDRAARVTLS
jgi:rhamnose utilization protein RhaD (predicted bifunctional aldolase and dehydrogenase)